MQLRKDSLMSCSEVSKRRGPDDVLLLPLSGRPITPDGVASPIPRQSSRYRHEVGCGRDVHVHLHRSYCTLPCLITQTITWSKYQQLQYNRLLLSRIELDSIGSVNRPDKQPCGSASCILSRAVLPSVSRRPFKALRGFTQHHNWSLRHGKMSLQLLSVRQNEASCIYDLMYH